MSDLTHRLRQWAISTDATPASDLMDAAADEIDGLRHALENDHTPAMLLAAYRLGVRHSNEQSPSGSGSGETSGSAPERQSPAGDEDGGLPLDAGAATSHHAAGGRGQVHNAEMATARLSAANTWLQDEIKRLRLTDEERAAITWYAGYGKDGLFSDTLRGLLERTK